MNDIAQAFDEFFPARLELLKALVNQNSYTTSRAGVHAVQSRLEDAFWEAGLFTERVSSPKRGDILIAKTVTESKDIAPILLVGHADTVHPVQSPFQFWKIDGDIMSGPGVLDMKGGIIHIFLVLDILKKIAPQYPIPLKVIINSAEENSTPMSAELIRQAARGASEALVFEIGRADGGIVTERKGITELWVTVKGKAAHSGNSFSDGINALVPLCNLAVESANLTDLKKDITVNVCQMVGGQQFCIVPDKATIGIEVRAGNQKDLEETVAKIREFAAIIPDSELIIDTQTLPLNKTEKTNAMFSAFQKAAAEVDFVVKELPRVGGLSDANLIGSIGIPTLDALGPYGTGAHTEQELIYISSMRPRVLAVVNYLLKKI